MNITEEMEEICFKLIACAGGAKSNYVKAIQCAKKGEYQEAHEAIKEGDKCYFESHEIHGDLIQKEADGQSQTLSLLLIHAEDQMMSCEVFKNMAEELIFVYKKINQLG